MNSRDEPVSVRYVLQHMVEEFARHAGHADILVEQIVASRRVLRAPLPVTKRSYITVV